MKTIKEQDKWKAGIPYRGNKRQKVNKILDLLPNGERFIDAFGGGGCVSIHAATAMKFGTVVYNELDPNIFQLFTEFAIKHNQIDLKRFVVPNRERFFIAKNREHKTLEDNIILTAWSFSNNRDTYLYGKKIAKAKEDVTRYLFEKVLNKSIKDTYAEYKSHIRQELQNVPGVLQQLQRLEQLERLQQLEQLQRLQQLEQLETVNGSYDELEIGQDDIVYCDPPYMGTKGYEFEFDHQKFIDWYSHQCSAREIYISEYTQLPNTVVVADLGNKHNMTAMSKRRNELLLKVVK